MLRDPVFVVSNRSRGLYNERNQIQFLEQNNVSWHELCDLLDLPRRMA